MARVSPTARTLKFFGDLGYETVVVERYIMGASIRKDYLSCIDIHILEPNTPIIIGVQCFSTAWAEHERKICYEYPEGAKFWLKMGHKLLFMGWRKLKVKRGGKAIRWTPRFGWCYLTKKGKVRLCEVENPWKEQK